MKKVIGVIVAIAAIAVIGMSLSKNIDSQPAQAGKVVPSTMTTASDVETVIAMDDIKGDSSEGDVAGKKKREGFWCEVNGNGTITYGSATWVGWWIFGHWEYGVGITIAGGANACAGFLEGVNTVQAP